MEDDSDDQDEDYPEPTRVSGCLEPYYRHDENLLESEGDLL